MTSSISVSVVIPVRNGAATIAEQLEALGRQEFGEPWEVVAADNRSNDGTREVIETFSDRLPGLRVVSADHGIGINVGRNAGVAAANGELILICDADDVVRPGWIEAHARNLAHYDLSGGPVDEISLNGSKVATFNSAEARRGVVPPTSGGFLPYAIGCNFAFTRAAWDAIGGFDEAWQRGSTEVEFCWRAQLAGFELGWARDAVVAYRHGTTIRSEVRRRYRSARSKPRLYAAFKHHGMPGRSLWKALRAWAWLLFWAPRAALQCRFRLKWVQVAAWRAGLLVGSLRYRSLYL